VEDSSACAEKQERCITRRWQALLRAHRAQVGRLAPAPALAVALRQLHHAALEEALPQSNCTKPPFVHPSCPPAGQGIHMHGPQTNTYPPFCTFLMPTHRPTHAYRRPSPLAADHPN
jgi:hypothetical protein